MKQELGYVMLIFIPTLLVVTVSISLVQPSINNRSVLQLQILSNARQQLIAYSASYLESYKPTSAGPGHLPCPDADQTPDEYQVQAGLRGDGPNPPCGKHSIAVGKLPRHISHGKKRYAFHLEDKHALWYAVDTRFINNPVNRVVNPDSVGRIRLIDQLPAAAVIFIPREGATIWNQADSVIASQLSNALQGSQDSHLLKKSISQYVLITPEVLLKAVSLRVALWLHDHYQASDLFNCVSNSLCGHTVMNSCEISPRDKILLLILTTNHAIKCDGSAADSSQRDHLLSDGRLDSVFLRRHWFYRNDWWRFVEIQLADACEDALVDCYAMVVVAEDRRRITLEVQPL